MRLVPVILLLATTLSAQTPEEVTSILSPIAKKNLSAAVVRTDGPIVVGGKAPRIPLSSIAEPVTATILGSLVDEGFITWETTVGNVFPEWRTAMRPEYAKVTLAQLLSHEGRIPAAEGTAQQILMLEPLPRSKRQYDFSAANYRVAAAMAEKITGQTWEQLVSERIVNAFGMKPTAAGVTVDELAKLARAHLVALYGHPTVVKADTARLLHTNRHKAALGFTVQSILNYSPISVGGSTSLIAIAPKQGLAFVVTSPSAATSRAALERLVQAYAPALPEAAPARPITAPRRPRIP